MSERSSTVFGSLVHRRRVDRVAASDERIFIRPVRPEDDVELLALFETLDADERYRRFFSSHHPSLAFCAGLATVDERGGARLVAVQSGWPPTEDRIIGEAGYDLLPNGDGELTVTVAPAWRGWLETCLFDALVDVALAAGVPNLEAEVLTVDGPMLTLLRSRPSVVMEHEGWSTIRLLLTTGDRMPTWPGSHGRPRVLVEGAGGRWSAEGAARAAGFEVHTCAGPHDGPHECPVLVGEPCPLAVEADVIVVAAPSDDERWQELLAGHAEFHPGVPVCVAPMTPRRENPLRREFSSAVRPIP
jgi:hypothetical protein